MWQLCSGIDENVIGACAQLMFVVRKLFEVMVSGYVPNWGLCLFMPFRQVAFGHSIWN